MEVVTAAPNRLCRLSDGLSESERGNVQCSRGGGVVLVVKLPLPSLV